MPATTQSMIQAATSYSLHPSHQIQNMNGSDNQKPPVTVAAWPSPAACQATSATSAIALPNNSQVSMIKKPGTILMKAHADIDNLT